jgi:lipopolysaccharide export system protein LptA
MPLRLLLRSRAAPAAIIAMMFGAIAPGRSAAQTGCRFGSGTGDFHSQEIPQGGRITWVGHPHFVCSDGVQIWADSAESFSAQNMSHLIGHVRFVDPTRELRADDARYFSRLGRLQAHGNLFVRDTVRGSVIENGSLEYLRQTSTRPVEQMTVTTGPDGVRPKALLYMRPARDTASTDTLATDTTAVPAGAERPPQVAPDTGVAVPDTVARPDTAVVAGDTTRAALPDTIARPDTTRAARGDTVVSARDTTRAAPPMVRPDTARVAADSTRAATRDTTAAADTTAVPLSGPPPRVRGRPALPESQPPDTAQTPYVVEANRLELHGDSAFTATGNVSIERDSLQAFSDTAVYDQGAGHIVLNGAARVESSGYDLAGRTVNLALPGGEISRVRAVHQAVLTGEQLRMTAPTISVFVTDGAMDRLVATPIRPEGRAQAPDSADLEQPVAVSDKFRLSADSLDVRAPGQVLDKMYAVGAARGESSAGDSLNVPELPEVARKDWIQGDTLVVTFVKVEPRPDQPNDSAHYDVDRLVAQGDASSLYRILPADSTARPGVDPPAIHYVLGTTITIVLDSGQVDHMEVEGPTGWHLEPLGRAAKDTLAPADTARGTATDTAKGQTKPDTGVARAEPKPRAGGGGGGSSPANGRSDKGIAHPVSPERERGRRRRRQR